ncbi:glycine/D-amino acid oxidase-like deaminating enzyme [Catenulispora sp. GAS73]|uniref:NAD(P)/FAD-dependent oxidoreductase n=1 Tax=Catenulispora sp. GAS73 TaxID=3156269 RepID=UPI0035116F67
MSDVVVVGAGIVGASVAYHLTRRGVAVTVLERESASAAGVTGGSFAWVGDTGGAWPGGARDLRGHVLADHRRLESELPEIAVRWTGSLTWGSDGNPMIYPGQIMVGADEIALLEPRLLNPPDRAVHIPTDGGVDPAATTAALLRGARAHGAEVVYGASAIMLNPPEGHGVSTSAGFHPAGTVVVAAGVATAALCRPLGVELPVAASPACLLRVAAPPGLVKTILAGPHFEVREVRDGDLLLTMPYTDGQSAESVEREARRTFHRLVSSFDGGAACRLLSHQVSGRPMPADGPIVGTVTPDRSVYVAVAHSAITLAPTLGRLVAEELVGGMPVDELRRCRPRLETARM